MPLVASSCPEVPVAFLESRSSPVKRNLSIVELARDENPEAAKYPVLVLLTLVRFVNEAFVLEMFVKVPDAEVRLSIIPLVAAKFVINAFVVVELPTIKSVI